MRCKYSDCKANGKYNGLCQIHLIFDVKLSGICLAVGCNKYASYGIAAREYCAAHKTSDMKNLAVKLCGSCNKTATYGITLRTHCASHKEPNMKRI